MWPYLWIAGMLALVITTFVFAMLESKARKKAMAQMQPQPLDPGLDGADPMAAGGDNVDAFGSSEGDLANLDENAFQ